MKKKSGLSSAAHAGRKLEKNINDLAIEENGCIESGGEHLNRQYLGGETRKWRKLVAYQRSQSGERKRKRKYRRGWRLIRAISGGIISEINGGAASAAYGEKLWLKKAETKNSGRASRRNGWLAYSCEKRLTTGGVSAKYWQ
jgi:hypothetical protein